ncbi:MAG: transcriptional regulator, TetR family [Actinomycetia bacterium]|nr:transcriptional regulator, TetR family [Actinomycetes bacterium]
MIGRVAERREERVASIVAAAWRLSGEHGVGGVSLRALAREVGIRQPSLYEYFDSKHALYDSMFADGNRQLLARLEAVKLPRDPRAAVKSFMQAFIGFSVEDVPRYVLLFQRQIPGFEPSAESYQPAQVFLNRAIELLHAAGLESQADVDCFIAMVAGLVDAQISNDPGGHRWIRHLNRLADMYLDEPKRRKRR